MSTKLARQGGAFLQHLNVSEAFSRPARQMISQTHIRRLSMFPRGRFAGLLAARAPVLRPSLINTYATAAKTKTKTTKAKDSEPKPKAAKGAAAQGTSKIRKVKVQDKDAVKEEKKKSKPLSEEQKKKALRKEIRQTKELCLTPPPMLPQTAFGVARKVMSETVQKERRDLRGIYINLEAIQRARNLTAEEEEGFARTAEENKAKNEEAMAKWIKSYTPTQIRDANKARRRLARLTGKKGTKHTMQLEDPRLVSRPLVPFAQFVKTQMQEDLGLASLPIKDRMRRIAESWKSVTPEEKEVYQQAYNEDKERYIREFKDVYGDEPSIIGKEARE
ncbi:HMG-box domain-containing protein [Aspergillus homomorphus CBS 101889]|uniref:HMG box domain-containing protein n=1 Tax=Aspergillus homomorphus (strain CBS 101889) TaxID=1450537 RepID=A0A395HUF6_ASPHC|nr:hypothetical protein BO97DRAFT_406188 [Aspergillus homomorphus CBS 101889]RAL11551.1 hypothetical protein BO97DRAFT_406188 [Aspergillus homomorphus CBS 101889]